MQRQTRRNIITAALAQAGAGLATVRSGFARAALVPLPPNHGDIGPDRYALDGNPSATEIEDYTNAFLWIALEGAAIEIADARTWYARHTELITAPEMPEPFRTALAEGLERYNYPDRNSPISDEALVDRGSEWKAEARESAERLAVSRRKDFAAKGGVTLVIKPECEMDGPDDVPLETNIVAMLRLGASRGEFLDGPIGPERRSNLIADLRQIVGVLEAAS